MKPSIFDYLDIILYLQSHYQWRKQADRDFSYTNWCTELNLGSKTILRFILQRKRRITEKSARVLKSNLKLSSDAEQLYFDHLLSYSQPKSEAERSAAGAKLISFQRLSYKQLDIDSELATQHALIPVILTLLTFKDFLAHDESIAYFLKKDINEIIQIMNILKTNGIVQEKYGIYFVNTESFKIADKPDLKSLRKFHEYWLEQSKNAFDLEFKQRRFRSLKFALTESEFENAIERINEFSVSLLSQFHNSQIRGRRLYMLESVLFPLTEIFTEKNSLRQSNRSTTPKTDALII